MLKGYPPYWFNSVLIFYDTVVVCNRFINVKII